MNASKPARPHIPAGPAIEVELLALDLTACTRCTGTLANIETAIKLLRPVLETTGRELRFRKIVIASEDQALWHRFTLSPTIRVNGRDLVFETFETPCESCADLCGCPEGTTCRQWRYRGRDHTEAPVGLIVEALLAAMAGVGGEVGVAGEGPDPRSARPLTPTLSPLKPGEREKSRSVATAVCSNAQEECCASAEREECCEADEKVACCASADSQSCGCR